MLYFIYKTTCTITGKYYIGKRNTKSLNDGYIGSGKILRYSVKKYGKENHIREILCYAENDQELCKIEIDIISKHKGCELCMNLADGGVGGDTRKGRTHSEETKKKISNTLKGHKHSEETKRKIGDKSKGRTWVMGEDHKKKISQANKNKPSNLKGVPRSEETKRKISEANKNRPFKKRKPLSAETKEKIRLTKEKRKIERAL